LVDVNR